MEVVINRSRFEKDSCFLIALHFHSFFFFILFQILMINLKEIKPRHHLQLLKTFPKTTPKTIEKKDLYV